MNDKKISRRGLLKGAAVSAGAALAFPTIVPSSVFGQNAPSKRVTLGHIGVGGQGGGLLGGFLGQAAGQTLAVCDPIKDRREGAAARVDKHYAARSDKDTYTGFFYVIMSGASANHVSKYQKYITL